MSMLSAQCDELREMADQLQEHGTFVGFGGTTNTDPLMHGAATAMLQAADTIWELRDDLQRANDAVRDAEHDESMAWDRVRKAEAENAKLREERREYQATIDSLVNECDDHKTENAKLRELVLHMYACMGNVDADGNHECFSCEYEGAGCDFADRMRDLGIEVC